jgi:hypothetical protein
MPILGPLRSIEDPDTFFFMRALPVQSREPMKAKFYEGSYERRSSWRRLHATEGEA